MKLPSRVLCGCFWLIWCAESCQAGLYNPCEIDEGPFNPDFLRDSDAAFPRPGFQEALAKFSNYSAPPAKAKDSPYYRRYLLLQALGTGPAKLTLDQKISLSEYLIRRGQPLQAKLLLLPLARQGEKNVLLLCNLATACHLVAEGKAGTERNSEFQEAIDYQSHALKLWPSNWGDQSEAQREYLQGMYWNEENYVRCRTAEEYYLKLLRNRFREGLRGAKAPDAVDALFYEGADAAKAIQYVGESGKFEPGKLAPAEKAKLPDGKIDRALAIVQQLLIWLPDDNRLYWQLGELYNARGAPRDLRSARKIIDDLVYLRQMPSKALKDDRWRKLNDLQIPAEEPKEGNSADALEKMLRKNEDKKNDEEAPSPAFDWRPLGVGFGAGVIVAVLASWQIREIRRRQRPPASRAA